MSSDEKARDLFGAELWARTLTVAPPCQIGAHDACDEMTAGFLADHPEAAPWDCRCLCHIGRYLAERDRARSVAVALEQELARKDQALDEIRALHKPERILTVGGSDEMCAHCRVRPKNAYDIAWPCATLRILSDLAAALDAHLNKEDDDQ